MVVYHRRPPNGSRFHDFNCPPGDGHVACVARLEDFVAGDGHTTVPHRQNRMVIFDSALLHSTDSYNFKPGFENRRINLTYLFGKGGAWKDD